MFYVQLLLLVIFMLICVNGQLPSPSSSNAPPANCAFKDRLCWNQLALQYVNALRAELNDSTVEPLVAGSKFMLENALNYAKTLDTIGERPMPGLVHQPITAPSGFFVGQEPCVTRLNGENLAWYSSDTSLGNPAYRCVNNAWRNSPGHYAIMINPKFRSVTTAIHIASDNYVFCVQTFTTAIPAIGSIGDCAAALPIIAPPSSSILSSPLLSANPSSSIMVEWSNSALSSSPIYDELPSISPLMQESNEIEASMAPSDTYIEVPTPSDSLSYIPPYESMEAEASLSPITTYSNMITPIASMASLVSTIPNESVEMEVSISPTRTSGQTMLSSPKPSKVSNELIIAEVSVSPNVEPCQMLHASVLGTSNPSSLVSPTATLPPTPTARSRIYFPGVRNNRRRRTRRQFWTLFFLRRCTIQADLWRLRCRFTQYRRSFCCRRFRFSRRS